MGVKWKITEASADLPSNQGSGATQVDFQDWEEENKLHVCPRRKAADRTTLCSSNCQFVGTGENASCPFSSNWLREGLQVKEIRVLLFLSSCSLKGVSVF